MYDKTDVEHVGWYYVPVENGAPLWMDPYLNGNVNVYMISYVVPLYVDGESVGIIGMDIDFSQITGMVEKTKAFSTGYSFLYKPDGSIMYHPEMENGADLEQLGMTADEKARMCDAANEGQVEGFSSNGTKTSAVFYLSLIHICTGTLHNLYTLRGAQVRDGNAWAEYIMESLALYGDQAEVVFQSHRCVYEKDSVQVEAFTAETVRK